MKFSGKNVLVTGASRGIGKAIALNLGSCGLKVWINYRSNPDKAQAVKDEIDSNGGQSALIPFDISNEEEFANAIKLIVDSDGELSYLVNNAGITKDKLSVRMSLDDFKEVIDVNLTSAFVGCREAIKVMMKKRFGAIVNISSIVGQMGNAGQVNYSASKGGMDAMTKSFAKEGGNRNIRCNGIAPGFIKTDMTGELKDEVIEYYKKNIPLSRMGDAEDVANGVAFLLSDNAGYITGEVLKLNGGLYM